MSKGKKNKLSEYLKKHGVKRVPHRSYAIGFSEKEQRWYGWSNRAIVGFRIGDRIFDRSYGNEQTPFRKHGRRKIKTLADAKKSATNFAKWIN